MTYVCVGCLRTTDRTKCPPEGSCCTDKMYRALSTQKTRGIFALREKEFHSGTSTNNWAVPLQKLMVLSREHLDFDPDWLAIQLEANEINPKQAFVRPCPVVPRHGFIDSRRLNLTKPSGILKLQALLKETMDENPNNELLITELIEAEFSAIITPTLIAIGPGHDGATGGKVSTVIPLVRTSVAYTAPYDAAGINLDKDDPYIEVVYRKDPEWTKPFMTQLRSGLKEDVKAGDWIPADTTVKTILHGHTDIPLLEWEATIQAAQKSPEGIVVWHPGGSVVDHISLHARYAGLPIVFGPEPTVGQVLTKNSDQAPLTINGFFDGFAAVEAMPFATYKSRDAALVYALTIHHNTPAMEGDEGSRMLGAAAGILLRLGFTAMRGEARHANDDEMHTLRETVYSKLVQYKYTEIRRSMVSTINVFRYGQFRSTGFGGIKWAQCSITVFDMLNSVLKLANDYRTGSATQQQLMDVLGNMNVMINQAHNNGWWLNKFTNPATFDMAQTFCPPLLAAMASPAMWLHLNQADGKEFCQKFGKRRPLTLRAPALREFVYDSENSGSSTMAFKPEFRMSAFTPKPIKIDLKKVGELMKSGCIPIRQDGCLHVKFDLSKLAAMSGMVYTDSIPVPQVFTKPVPKEKKVPMVTNTNPADYATFVKFIQQTIAAQQASKPCDTSNELSF